MRLIADLSVILQIIIIPSALSASFRESTFCCPSFPSLRSLYVMVAVYSLTSSEGLMSTANLVGKDNV